MSMEDFVKTLSEEQKNALLEALNITDKDKNKGGQQEPQNINSDFMVSSKKQNNRRREPVKARKNQWVDNGEFRDIETEYGEKTPRRKPHKKIDVECSVCGKSFKADPKYVYGEYHRCNSCTGR